MGWRPHPPLFRITNPFTPRPSPASATSSHPGLGPAQPKPARPSTTQPSPAQPNTAQPSPAQPSRPQPAQPKPAHSNQIQPSPAQLSPAQSNPAQPSPAQPASANPTQRPPAQPNQAQPNPIQPSPTQLSSIQPNPTQPRPLNPPGPLLPPGPPSSLPSICPLDSKRYGNDSKRCEATSEQNSSRLAVLSGKAIQEIMTLDPHIRSFNPGNGSPRWKAKTRLACSIPTSGCNNGWLLDHQIIQQRYSKCALQ